jgi:hypothetical protein
LAFISILWIIFLTIDTTVIRSLVTIKFATLLRNKFEKIFFRKIEKKIIYLNIIEGIIPGNVIEFFSFIKISD